MSWLCWWLWDEAVTAFVCSPQINAHVKTMMRQSNTSFAKWMNTFQIMNVFLWSSQWKGSWRLNFIIINFNHYKDLLTSNLLRKCDLASDLAQSWFCSSGIFGKSFVWFSRSSAFAYLSRQVGQLVSAIDGQPVQLELLHCRIGVDIQICVWSTAG